MTVSIPSSGGIPPGTRSLAMHCRLAPLAAWSCVLALCCCQGSAAQKVEVDGKPIASVDPVNPYYPHRDFPRLITPLWAGEPGVEAVVVLAIDDMRDPARYEAYLRPILNRLKAIDGRAP